MQGREMRYESMIKQCVSLIEGETDIIANLSNVSALLNDFLEDVNWVGFYLLKNGELVLGPFQGPVACVRIKVGSGVCGAAVSENKIQVVKDVHKFPGHIACDLSTNSEIVVPIIKEGKIFGVLDIDSESVGRFDDVDAKYLGKLVEYLV
ncbi:MAG: GAF domain-containing protein [Clostridiales bacterium]|nr:GAF domain-containing protein [Clostridiales bacterium]